MDIIESNIERTVALLQGSGGNLVAYSGGVDSTLVCALAWRANGNAFLAVLANSPLLFPGEKDAALTVARQIGFPVEVIEHPGWTLPEVRGNTAGRCYACKSAIFSKLNALAADCGLETVCCGDNADDLAAGRPGLKAAREADVRSPLQELGIDKQMVRAMARRLELPNADLVSSSCLATRMPQDHAFTTEELHKVAKAEMAARRLFPGARVRAHLS